MQTRNYLKIITGNLIVVLLMTSCGDPIYLKNKFQIDSFTINSVDSAKFF